MGVRGSGPSLIDALEAHREQLADRSRLLTVRHTILPTALRLGAPDRDLRYAIAAGAW